MNRSRCVNCKLDRHVYYIVHTSIDTRDVFLPLRSSIRHHSPSGFRRGKLSGHCNLVTTWPIKNPLLIKTQDLARWSGMRSRLSPAPVLSGNPRSLKAGLSDAPRQAANIKSNRFLFVFRLSDLTLKHFLPLFSF
jgi:hypothetical protein